MGQDVNINAGRSMKPFFMEVTKAFAEYSGNNEIITAHGPKTHGHETLHSQINLINRSNGNALKIRFGK
jgi:hypothetical protein